MPRGECESVQLPNRHATTLVAGVQMWGSGGAGEDGLRGRANICRSAGFSDGRRKRSIGLSRSIFDPLDKSEFYLYALTRQGELAEIKGPYIPQENQRHAGGGISSV